VIITSAAQTILKGVAPEKLWDPVFILSQITSATAPAGLSEPLIASAGVRTVVAVVALLGVAVATISVNIAANVVSPANDFANLAPKYISFKTGGLITGVLGILMMPWKLLSSADAYIFQWLLGYSALLGPIAGVMIADYWVIRRRQLDVPDLYRLKGRYFGMNEVALAALTLGVLPNIPGFLKTAGVVSRPENAFDTIYPYAWFTGFIVAFAMYVVGSRLRPDRVQTSQAGVRPRAITLTVALGAPWLCGVFALQLWFKWADGLVSTASVVEYGLMSAVGGACLWALWRMRQWGVALAVAFGVLMQVVLVSSGGWRLDSLSVPLLTAVFGIRSYRSMT